jgi:hypothetical protein
MSDNFDINIINSTLQLIENTELTLKKAISVPTSNYFSGIKSRVLELSNLQKLKLSEIDNQRKSINKIDKQEFDKYKKELEILYSQKQPLKFEQEKLREHKKQLVEQEKEIKRPKKESNEYFKKQELKQELAELQEKINELSDQLKPINADIQEINSILYQVQNIGKTQFDSNIDEQFYKISNSINDLIFLTSDQITENQKLTEIPNFENIDIDIKKLANHFKDVKFSNTIKYDNFILSLNSDFFNNLSEPEINLYSICLNSVLLVSTNSLGDISENSINEVLKIVISQINKNENNKVILQVLENTLSYRLTRQGEYVFPENSLVLNSFLAFIIKPNSADELTKFLNNKNVSDYFIAYSIWGAFYGFANMPKTFTNIIFESANDKLFDVIDNYLFNKYLTI